MPIDPNVSNIADEELDRAIAEKTDEMKPKSTLPDSKPLTAEEMRRQSAKGHRERVRERFLKSGLDGFAEHEILELLLFYAIPRQDTKQTAHTLIKKFGSVAGVFDASVDELCKIKGITQNSAVLFKLVPRLVDVYYSGKNVKKVYTDSNMLAQMFKPMFVGESTEKFMLACFDNSLRRISVTEISRGSPKFTVVDMRKIMNEVTRTCCTMAAIAHNHPKSSPRPSDEDVIITKRIAEALKLVDVMLMDHIIVGEKMTCSMRERNDLAIFE